MAELQEKLPDWTNDVETLRRLWDEGVHSGPPKPLDLDEARKRAKDKLAAVTSGK